MTCRFLAALYLVWGLSLMFSQIVIAEEDRPVSLDPRLVIELVAESPQLVTPTGIDVDQFGRVWVIESHTHFPPEGYGGHPTDRILVMDDRDRDGRADDMTVFKDGLTHSMSIAVKPVWLDADASSNTVGKALQVYIATRREIFLCTDIDGDLKCDTTTQLVHLETTGNYPHNGLAGFGFDALGYMYFGFGENLGADYKIIGSDQIILAGGGEGGNLYRCRPDGTKLERWATGFWNPHASCFDQLGRMFAVDNDPDSRPPCRLLHAVQNGDYGYRFRNGRKGTHPFTSWNGEIPGTLPMVSGTGEAPSGIICYEADQLPAEFRGTLLVGSWGDHRIDQFVLRPRGISFESIPQPVIKGGENFRPVGLAVSPDGSIYVTDWVSKEYKLHGQGRLWRISAKERPVSTTPWAVPPQMPLPDVAALLDSPILNTRRSAARRLASTIEGRKVLENVPQADGSSRKRFEVNAALGKVPEAPVYLDLAKLDLSDPFVLNDVIHHTAAMLIRIIDHVARPGVSDDSLKQLIVEVEKLDPSAPARHPRETEFREIAMLLALRLKFPKEESLLHFGLRSTFPSSRRLAVQWIGEENLGRLRPDVEKVLASEPMTTDLFLACLASLSLLDGVSAKEFEKTPPAKYILEILINAERPAALRAMALRMLPSSQPELDAGRIREFLNASNAELRREAVRTLQHSPIPERVELLRETASNHELDHNLRADAVAGLAPSDHQSTFDPATRNLLMGLATSDPSIVVQSEAIRSLRGAPGKADTSPRDPAIDALFQRLTQMLPNESAASRAKLADVLEFTERGHSHSVAELSGLVLPTDRAPSLISDNLDRDAVEMGRRTFFRANGAGCYRCHQISGRGGQVGPDLTVIARTMDRTKLFESIVNPSKEISPQFTTWAIETKSGKVVTGLLLGEEVNGDLRLGNQLGEVIPVPFSEIETRTPMKTSVMPEKLHETMSVGEFRDLLTFLETLK
ncbi:PVC-type heme-binding CxxCH protein [Schlesneria paludicola]|uniref:PVC-type heme-binding CxxCH protein n=1 Tax=Schlesneria paludicola TaxID=360056 RepID=UPI00029B22D4|nr:PVC-type heme-binding CxxCH protein [Schlesneria paludicola]